MAAERAARHYAGGEAAQVVEWKCPGCGEGNLSVLGTACAKCGAGGGAKHVGIDPIVRKGQTEAPLKAVKPQAGLPANLSTPFDLWLVSSGIPTDTAGYVLMQKAWNAAIAWYEGDRRRTAVDMTPDAQPESSTTTLPGTRESRTIAAALRVFLDQVVANSDTQDEAYEWLQPEEIEQLIQKLEETAE